MKKKFYLALIFKEYIIYLKNNYIKKKDHRIGRVGKVIL